MDTSHSQRTSWGLKKVWLRWMARDLIRKHGVRWMSYAQFLKYLLVRAIDPRSALNSLFTAHRYRPSSWMSRFVHAEKSTLAKGLDYFVDVSSFSLEERYIRRSIVLKNPSVQGGKIEKGVLLITFTETFPFFYRCIDCERLMKYFYVVLEPSWAGYCDPNILFWMKFSDHPVVVEATEASDFVFLQSLQSNLVPVTFGASDWADFRTFKPIPGTAKIYDAIYVTNYHPIKRQHVFFRAIRDLQDPTYRAAIAFGINGEAKTDIHDLISYFGVRENLTIYEGLSQQELNKVLNMSKVNVLFSLKEGSNRSIFEALFADVPGIVLEDSIGPNKTYINSWTGRLVHEREVADSLKEFRHRGGGCAPREWAMKNISPLVTTEKLAGVLQACALEKGEPWSRGIAPKVNAPEVQYFYEADEKQMLPSRAVIECFRKGRVPRASDSDEMNVLLKGTLRQL